MNDSPRMANLRKRSHEGKTGTPDTVNPRVDILIRNGCYETEGESDKSGTKVGKVGGRRECRPQEPFTQRGTDGLLFIDPWSPNAKSATSVGSWFSTASS